MGPQMSWIWPNDHLGCGCCWLKLRTNTGSPISKTLTMAWSSWLLCHFGTVLDRSDLIASNSERVLWSSNSSAGALPVAVAGVKCWLKRNLVILVSISLVDIFFMADLKVWMALSVSPLEEGWYREERTWRMAFLSTNSWNSALVNGVPLSDTNNSGRPCVAKELWVCRW